MSELELVEDSRLNKKRKFLSRRDGIKVAAAGVGGLSILAWGIDQLITGEASDQIAELVRDSLDFFRGEKKIELAVSSTATWKKSIEVYSCPGIEVNMVALQQMYLLTELLPFEKSIHKLTKDSGESEIRITKPRRRHGTVIIVPDEAGLPTYYDTYSAFKGFSTVARMGSGDFLTILRVPSSQDIKHQITSLIPAVEIAQACMNVDILGKGYDLELDMSTQELLAKEAFCNTIGRAAQWRVEGLKYEPNMFRGKTLLPISFDGKQYELNMFNLSEDDYLLMPRTQIINFV